MSRSDFENHKQFTFELAKKYAIAAVTQQKRPVNEVIEELKGYDLDDREFNEIADILRGIDKTR